LWHGFNDTFRNIDEGSNQDGLRSLEEQFPNISIQVAQEGGKNQTDADKIIVDFYYEVLCPDSRSFFLYQLYPAWQSLSPIFSVNFLPYGKAYTYSGSDRYRFSCQHGPKECQGNIYHACAAAHISNEQDRMDYLRCMIYDNYDPQRAAIRCSEEIDVDWSSISNCAKGKEGNVLHKLAGEKTHALIPKVTFIPTIELNGDQFNQRYVRQNFKRQLCRLYQGTNKPEDCLRLVL